jgi:glycosyltransferase involved in cell wall biosynthesis
MKSSAMSERVNWIILTPSYPPNQGGIADYSWVLARELAQQGDGVNVWTGPCPPDATDTTVPSAPGISTFHLPTHFTLASCRILEREIARIPEPRRLLVQYVPQPFGPRGNSRFQGLPLWFAYWLRHQQSAPCWLIVHEAETSDVAGMSWKARLLHRLSHRMLGWVLENAERVYYSMPAWERVLKRQKTAAKLEYLPVPSNMECRVSVLDARNMRNRLLDGGVRHILGHFGTYSPEITSLLQPVLEEVLHTQPQVQVLLIGQGSCEFAARLRPFNRRVVATGALESREVARHLAACDLMVQPFPDGASTRRGSLMASIALGVPVLSNIGGNSESVWLDTGALALNSIEAMPQRIATLMADPEQRESIGAAGRILYQQRFSLDRTITALRGQPSRVVSMPAHESQPQQGPRPLP